MRLVATPRRKKPWRTQLDTSLAQFWHSQRAWARVALTGLCSLHDLVRHACSETSVHGMAQP